MAFDDFDASVTSEEFYGDDYSDEQLPPFDDEPAGIDDDTDFDPYAGMYDQFAGEYDNDCDLWHEG